MLSSFILLYTSFLTILKPFLKMLFCDFRRVSPDHITYKGEKVFLCHVWIRLLYLLCAWELWQNTALAFNFKGALDKYNIYLFVSNCIEDNKLNQYWNFQLILPMRFHFTRYFANSIIFRVSQRLLYCAFF